jgi:hypothetical protein
MVNSIQVIIRNHPVKHLSNERGVASILIAIFVLVVVAAAGLAVYNASKAHQKTASTVSSSSPSLSTSPESSLSPAATATPTPTPAPTDQDLIVAVLKAHYGEQTPGSKFTQCRLEGNYAVIGFTPAGTGGGEDWLKKSNGTWTIAWQGQNYNPATQASSLGFPQGFGTSCTSNTVLYTY